jgi:hypothetical protein
MDARHVKAEQIVAGGKITRGNGYYMVPSQSGAARHKAVLDGLFPSCTCADFELTTDPKTCPPTSAHGPAERQSQTVKGHSCRLPVDVVAVMRRPRVASDERPHDSR